MSENGTSSQPPSADFEEDTGTWVELPREHWPDA